MDGNRGTNIRYMERVEVANLMGTSHPPNKRGEFLGIRVEQNFSKNYYQYIYIHIIAMTLKKKAKVGERWDTNY